MINEYSNIRCDFQNPDDDYDWDPDIFAIHRRNVYFIISERNTQMITLMKKLKGKTGTLRKDRLHYIVGTFHFL